jgi:histidine triad (HIT) family protein
MQWPAGKTKNKSCKDKKKEKMSEETQSNNNETQKTQCIFCQIIAGKISSRRVYEDDSCVAILDINPANPGHTLILPKEHYSIMPLMPEKELLAMFKLSKEVSQALIRSMKADGTNIFVANGAAAGQKSPHVMLHVIPRRANDGITCFTLPKNKVNDEDQEKLRRAIKGKLDEQLGIKEKEQAVVERPAPQKVEHKIDPKLETKEEDAADEQQEEENRQDTKKQEEPKQEEEYHMFEIPPPEKFEHHDTEQHEKGRKKKEFDLDTISKLFG